MHIMFDELGFASKCRKKKVYEGQWMLLHNLNGGVDEVSVNLIERMHEPLIAFCIIIDYKMMIIRWP